MVKMDFSPKLISRTPSSHPEADVSSPPLDDDAIRLTSNDSTDSDPCLEGTAARGGIKPLQQQILRQWSDHMIWPYGCVALTVFPCNRYAGLPRHGDCRCIQSWPHLPSRACLCHSPPWALFWWHPLCEGMWIWTWNRDVLELWACGTVRGRWWIKAGIECWFEGLGRSKQMRSREPSRCILSVNHLS